MGFWNVTIHNRFKLEDNLTSIFVMIVPDSDCNDSSEVALLEVLDRWAKMVSWRNHKFKGQYSKTNEEVKAGSLYLNSIWYLCKIILDYSKEFNYQADIDDCDQWYESICAEIEACIIQSFSNQAASGISPFRYWGTTKINQEVKKELQKLQSGEIPDTQNFPNFYKLIFACSQYRKTRSNPETRWTKREIRMHWELYKVAYQSLACLTKNVDSNSAY